MAMFSSVPSVPLPDVYVLTQTLYKSESLVVDH